MLYREIIAVCSEIHTKHINAFYTHTPPQSIQLAILPTDVNWIYDYQFITQSRGKCGLMGKVPVIALTWDKTRDFAFQCLYASGCIVLRQYMRELSERVGGPRSSSRQR